MESDPDARELVRRADAMFGSQLVGILLYGSWVRGEAARQVVGWIVPHVLTP